MKGFIFRKIPLFSNLRLRLEPALLAFLRDLGSGKGVSSTLSFLHKCQMSIKSITFSLSVMELKYLI